MPSQSFLSKRFTPGGPLDLRGSISNLPYEGKLNYHLALDKKCPTLKNLQGSYGFPVERLSEGKNFYAVTCPEDFRPARERYEELDTEFKGWNDPSLTFHQRLMLGETKPPGFALVVRKGEDGEPCHFCFLSAPVLTKPNQSARSGFGAPVLADIFDATVTDHLKCPRPVGEPNHLMLGSLCGTTLGIPLDEGRQAFAKALLPVIMSDGSALGQKPLNGASWKILIFPQMSECPVGFVWPATISFAEFCDSLENRNSKVFGGLLHLLGTQKGVIKDWFDAVNDNSQAFAVPVVSAAPLWDTFPTVDQPNGKHLIGDCQKLAPFQIQQDRFLRNHFTQIVRRGPVAGANKAFQIAGMQYDMFIKRATLEYPTEQGGGGNLSAAYQPFVSQMMQPMDGWRDDGPNWCANFTLDEMEVPSPFHLYPTKDIPKTAKAPPGYKPQRLVRPSEDEGESFDDFIAASLQLEPAEQSDGLEDSSSDTDEVEHVATRAPPPNAGGPNRSEYPPAGGPYAQMAAPTMPPIRDRVAAGQNGVSWSTSQSFLAPVPDSSPHEVDEAGYNVHAGNPFAHTVTPLNQQHQPFHQSGRAEKNPRDETDWTSPFATKRPRMDVGAHEGPFRPTPSPFRGSPTPNVPVRDPFARTSSPFHPSPVQQSPFHHVPLQQHPQVTPGRYTPTSPYQPTPQSPYPHSPYPQPQFVPDGLGGYYQTMVNPAMVAGYPSNGGLVYSNVAKPSAVKIRLSSTKMAEISTSAHRTICPPVFISCCFWLIHDIEAAATGVVHCRKDGEHAQPLSPKAVFRILVPSELGRQVLSGVDHKDDGSAAAVAMVRVIRYRARMSHGQFGSLRLPSEQLLTTVMDNVFVQKGFDMNTWSVDPERPPPSDAKQFSVLSFLPCLDTGLSSSMVLRGGITLDQAKQLGMIIYYFFAMLRAEKPTRDGDDYDDGEFQRSIFGSTLFLMCNTLVQNGDLTPLWMKYPEMCTTQYIRDLTELLYHLKSFVDYRSGADMGHYGIHEARLASHPDYTFMVVSSTMESRRSTTHTAHLLSVLIEYRDRMHKTWDCRYYNLNDPLWSAPCTSVFLQASISNPTWAGSDRSSRNKLQQDDRIGTTKSGKEKEKDKVVFVNGTPPFVWNDARTPLRGRDPVVAFQGAKVARGGYPHLEKPNNNGKKMVYPICLNSAFESHRRCNDTAACRAFTKHGKPGIGRTRVHIDLEDTKWSTANYPEENWKEVVTFVKKYHDYLLPTEAFKQLTPNTQW
jgi:hypothetical protein